MRMQFALVAALLLVGCGEKQPAHEQKHADGAAIVPAFPDTPRRAGHEAPPAPPPVEGNRMFGAQNYPEPPFYLPIYPGAIVKSGFVRAGRIRGGSLIFETTAQPADVITFYEKTTTQAGFVQTLNSATGGTIAFGAAAGRRNVHITAEPISGGSHVQIFWAGVR